MGAVAEHRDKPSILVVDDDAHVRKVLDMYLTIEGFDVRGADCGEAMREAIAAQTPDLVVLDLNLPDTTGFELARELSSDGAGIGIIMLTGSDEKVDKIVGLETGADDYIEKPFDERELLARIRSVLRRRIPAQRAGKRHGDNAIGRFGDMEIDLVSQTLTKDGKAVSLTNHEFNLLALLVENANTVLSRDCISEKTRSRDWLPTDRSIDVMMSKLRRKIEANPNELIKTIRGAGYVLAAQVDWQ